MDDSNDTRRSNLTWGVSKKSRIPIGDFFLKIGDLFFSPQIFFGGSFYCVDYNIKKNRSSVDV